MIKHASALAIVTMVLLLANPVQSADVMNVTVSIAPQKYFVEKIGKGLVKVNVMIPEGASPHTYEPRPNRMKALAGSKLYFGIGVAFEDAWLGRLTSINPKMTVIHTETGIEHQVMGDHGLDPHIWLSPPFVKILANNIKDALIKADQVNSKAYEANCQEFNGEIDRLHTDLTNMFKAHQGSRFMVFHPSWGHFAQTYRLIQVPIESEGKKPSLKRLKDIIEQAKEMGIKAIFVQPQFSSRDAELMAAALGGTVVPVDPLAYDWSVNLYAVAAKFKSGLR